MLQFIKAKCPTIQTLTARDAYRLNKEIKYFFSMNLSNHLCNRAFAILEGISVEVVVSIPTVEIELIFY